MEKLSDKHTLFSLFPGKKVLAALNLQLCFPIHQTMLGEMPDNILGLTIKKPVAFLILPFAFSFCLPNFAKC